MKYYSAIEKNEVLKHTTTWMNLENMLSQRSQAQKSPYFKITIYMKCTEKANLETERFVLGN